MATNLNWVDYIVLIIFFLSILIGLKRGLVKEVIALVTLIAAIIIAALFSNPLAEMITHSASVQSAVNQASASIGANAAQPVSYAALGISFALLFIATIIVGAIISSLLNIAVQTGILGIGNRLLGAVFGLVRGFFINLVIIFVVQLTPLGNQAWWHQSQFVTSFQTAVQWLGNIVSPSLADLKTKFGQTVQNANATIQGAASGTYTGLISK